MFENTLSLQQFLPTVFAAGLLLFLAGFMAARFLQQNRRSDRRQAQEMERLVQIGRLISSTLDIEEVYDRFAGEVRQLIPFDRMDIILFNLQNQTGKIANVTGLDIPGRNVGDTFPLQGSIVAGILQTWRGIFCNPADESETAEHFPFFLRYYQKGMRSYLAVPLTVRDRVIGRLGFQSQTPNAYGEEALRLGQRIADQIAGTIASAQLFAELKQTEQSLRESEERYRQTYEGASEGIFRSTPAGRYLFVNPAMARMCGYASPEEMVATIQDLAVQHYAVQEERDAFRKAIAASGRVENFEYRVRCKNGRQMWMSVNAHEVRDEKGVLLYYEGTNQDITWRKEAEEERRRLEERLQRAEKMEALGTLAGGVAHDLNNILGPLVGYSELLLSEIAEENPQREYVENILQSGERGAAIIQDLLTLARRGVAVSEVLNLNGVVTQYGLTPELANLKARHPLVTFRMELDEELLNVRGSPVHLNKTVMNLVTNAVESITGEGEVVIRTGNLYMDRPVKGYDEIQEGDYVFLSVADNGKGISPDALGKIFEPFYTRKIMGRSGTGLGLAVVWGAVKDHHGYIDVQSEEDKGSCFTLYFPVTREELAKEETAVAPAAYGGKGEAILVVDDMREQRELAVCMLEKLGYRVVAVASGEDALQYLRESKVDLLVLDMIMDPGIDGLETYRQALAIHPGQKAVIVSGFSETDRVKKAQELGAGGYVCKPYIRERIGLAIRRELDRT